VEDDETMRKSIRQLIVSGGDANITETSAGKEAVEALAAGNFDCMVLDLGLPDMTGFELLDRLEQSSIPPVIVYTARELNPEQEVQLRRYSETIIVKGPKSEDRLMDEISLFLHRKPRGKKNRRIVPPRNKDSMFSDKKILLADDDMRNVFALSKILSERGMKVLKAEDGVKALSLLDKNPETDLVLMDIMMPVMDGYEAMKKIREQDRFRKLPVIALTAKAMMADRAKCIAAGASDYLTKPVDTERLLSMMRVWLYR
jgi:CheY-like chemotaxis protein